MAQGLALLDESLPGKLEVQSVGEDNLPRAYFTLTDEQGVTFGSLWIQPYGDSCPENLQCDERYISTGLLYLIDGAKDDKRGLDHTWRLSTDSFGIELHLDNVRWIDSENEKTWEEARPSLPLDMEKAVKLFADERWITLMVETYS